MDNMKFCQSCAMPLEKPEDFGTNKDGSRNEDYCVYCFKDGEFTENLSMEEMISYCADHHEEWQIPMPKEVFVSHMKENFPKLKRWAKA